MPTPIILGSDHAGFALKEELKQRLQQKGLQVEDIGAPSGQPVDYPVVAHVLALGGRSLDHGVAGRILDIWLETPFEGGRHARRVALIELATAEAEVK